MPSFYQSSAPEYYDEFSRHLLKDYVYGNKRIEFAIRHALRWIPAQAKTILDVGCGIGWSSWTFKRHFPNSEVTGLDLGTQSIAFATRMFEEEGLEFLRQDFTEEEQRHRGAFDAITMLDVYEHFTREQRVLAHLALARLLGEDGVFVLTYPSVKHQEAVLAQGGAGVQPVDEYVTDDDLDRLAEGIGARVVFRRERSIFGPGDYVHAVIRRSAGRTIVPNSDRSNIFESKHGRAQRVVERLHCRVTPGGALLPVHPQPGICMIFRSEYTDCQPLERCFVESIPVSVRFLCGGIGNARRDDGESLLSVPDLWTRVRHAAARRLHRPTVDPALAAALRGLWNKERIASVVVAEIGLAEQWLPVCRDMDLPMSVWAGPRSDDSLNAEQLHSVQALQGLHSFVTGSAEIHREMKRVLSSNTRVEHIPLGIDTEALYLSPPNNSPPRIVSFHSTSHSDSPELVLLAFRQVLAEEPAASLVMAGGPSLAHRCGRTVQWLGLSPSVCFAVVASDAALARLFADTRAVLCVDPCSGRRFATEGEYWILAAMAAGRPVIALDSRLTCTILGDGHCGLVVVPGEPAELARALLPVLLDSHDAAAQGSAARTKIVSTYSLRRNVRRYVDTVM